MHFRRFFRSTLFTFWLANAGLAFNLEFLPQTIFRVGMLINVPFYDNIFHGLMFRGNYPIFPQANSTNSTLDRWALYSSLEGILDRLGVAGRPCLQRAVCEAASNRLDHDGLLGQFLHLVLSPSSSSENHEEPWHQEYVEAEKLGQEDKDCSLKFGEECPKELLDIFTKLA